MQALRREDLVPQKPEPQSRVCPISGPLYSLPPFLGHLEQVGELLFGLREYHPTITVGVVLGPWGGEQFLLQDAGT